MRAGACKAQAARLLDLVLRRPGSTLSLSFLMSYDLAQHIRWRLVGEDWTGVRGEGDRAMLIDPAVQQQVPARVCVCVHPGPPKQLGAEHST